ncbi:hypothetical protein A2X44_04090 [candidate division CPR3 bacterium GWF2_35_18]|uniref:MutT/nudix family protein n=1 Tax=candidate division CPR3 bacterium GW2011_GWF2_35_18 TaxID=1618350 RepID=A0A0G0EPR0_UNCC3|nr:MAG: MutT/nudix family protein [candidate division CPR3 bacterium GW2011_GWF2_35_18]OGB62535.1 MAG: hypothetical protein A2X44_04090 [candidate division CPR3 bacterium GWF2_35_18]OGB65786.1 MAG: hypothetical protein A2250_01340 [candidate division CPR3 bacterium RIFOXYA2_FULL_35_13]OGB76789.1 MAG: hypothetical protein A2476_00035 [candidate division CPR3 bacterium RIFOXYC2_FULL_35_7]OGB79296.1 MAG: hypothetical protein A2296_03970 [candidate division CPR3 bacterium RIFOXYB2_FULL_35_8]
MQSKKAKIKVGVGVMIFNKEQKVLLGKRLGKHGDGEYAFPGGKVEVGETFVETAIRETKEETNLDLKDPKVIAFSNNLFIERYENQWVTIYLQVHNYEGKLINVEPDKCLEWNWYDLKNLPKPLFVATRLGIECYLNNKFYSESKSEIT